MRWVVRRPRFASYGAAGAILLVAAIIPSWVSAQPDAAAPAYRIGPKDLLEIKVTEIPELNLDKRVDDSGSVDLPIMGQVALGGLTTTEAAERLKTRLESQYVQRATVTVAVKEYRSKPIMVIGAVKKPGYLDVFGRMTLIEALLAAGGLGEGPGTTIYVLRQGESGLTDRVEIKVDDLLLDADPKVNIPIQPGDIINVPSARQVIIYCLGELRTAGALSFSAGERATVLTAVARAGGLSDRASSKLRIKRVDTTGKDRELQVDFKAILAGRAEDVELKHGDILIAKGTFF